MHLPIRTAAAVVLHALRAPAAFSGSARGAGLAFVRVSLVLAFLSALGACAGLEYLVSPPERPTAAIGSVELTGLSFDHAEVTAVVELQNPNDFELDVDSLDYSMSFGDFVPVSEQATDEDSSLRIPAEDSVDVELPMRVEYEDLFSSVPGLAEQRTTEYTVTVVPAVSVPVSGTVELPLEHSDTLPLLRLPEVSLERIELREVGLSSAELGLDILIDNPNDAAIVPQSLPYEFSVGDRSVISGDAEMDSAVEGDTQARKMVTVEIPFVDVGNSFRDAIIGEAPLPYSFEGEFTFGTDLPLVEETTVPFSYSGQQRL